jgi:hypothetical protein
VRLSASSPTPNLEDQGIRLRLWLLPLDLSGMGDPTSSYAPAGIALRVSGALKPHHHDQVGTHRWGYLQLSRFYLETETESRLRNVVFSNINRKVY